jgi:hypothetical protein
MQLCHLEELYTQYGPFAEIWFDGGAPCMKAYEEKITELTVRYQPQAVAFQGPPAYPNNIRWVGTEAGMAPDDTWSSAASSQDYGAGTRNGKSFVPAEADTCIRTASCCAPGGPPATGTGSAGCWVWYPNTTETVKDASILRESYLSTVGHNSNLLLNISPNMDGDIDHADMEAYRSLGAWVNQTFMQTPIAKVMNQEVNKTAPVLLQLPSSASKRSYVVVQEDQTDGQRIWGWKIDAKLDGAWMSGVFNGSSIGHKRILPCAGELAAICDKAQALMFLVTQTADDRPVGLRTFAVH